MTDLQIDEIIAQLTVPEIIDLICKLTTELETRFMETAGE